MTTATTRSEANRQDLAETTAGTAVRCLHGFKDGMAGLGRRLGSGDEVVVVAERAEAFGRELGAVGAMGHLLAHRVALLSVRLESLAVGEMIAVRAAEVRARADFDADRVAAIDELIAAAEAPDGDAAMALGALAECPDGVARLLVAWQDRLARLRGEDGASVAESVARWLGLGADPAAPQPAQQELTRRVEAEIGRLRQRLGLMGDERRAIEQARLDAGRLARLDPGPEARLARRYEAAAERGMYRAMRAIAELNRQAGRGAGTTMANAAAEVRSSFDLMGIAPPGNTPVPPAAPSPPLVRPEPAPALDPLDPLGSFRARGDDSLGSFRAGVGLIDDLGPLDPIEAVLLDPARTSRRHQRPDLRKVHQRLARGRR